VERRIRTLLVAVLLLGLAALACSVIPDLGASSDDAPEGDSAAVVEDDSDDGASEDSGIPEPMGTLDLDDPALYDIAAVGDYYSTLVYRFEGTQADGTAVTGAMFAEGATTLGPPAGSHLIMRAEGAAAEGVNTTIELVLIEETAYFNTVETGCVVLPAQELDNPYDEMIDASEFLSGDADLLESGVMVNGVLTDQYRLDADNIDSGDPESGEQVNVEQGSIFVARQGGYVVRVVIEGTGYSEVLSGDPTLEGQISYELDFTPSDQPIEILPPEGCAGADDSDYPVLDDAFDITSVVGLYSYYTNYSFDDVVSFYKTQMAAAGWALSDELLASPVGMLAFTRADEQVQVLISGDPGTGVLNVIIGALE